jgi:RND family efflux transporter MFP subunit
MGHPQNAARKAAGFARSGDVAHFTAGILLLFASLAGAAESIPVQTRTFAELAIYPQQSAPATVLSINHSRISAELSARIVDIAVQVGDQVNKGALLVQLAPEDFALVLKRASANLANIDANLTLAEYEFKRALSLSKSQAVSEQLLKQRESTRDALRAQQQGQQAAVAQAQRQLSKASLYAPFDAVVVERIANIGEFASLGTPLLRIIDVNNVELSAKIQAQQAAALLHAAQRADNSLRFISNGQPHKLTLRAITPLLDSQARVQDVRLRFSADDAPEPLPGTSGKLHWRSQHSSLPAALISQRKGKLGVFVLERGRAHFIVLAHAQIGRAALAELKPDTAIITEGRYRLRDGDAVKLSRDQSGH